MKVEELSELERYPRIEIGPLEVPYSSRQYLSREQMIYFSMQFKEVIYCCYDKDSAIDLIKEIGITGKKFDEVYESLNLKSIILNDRLGKKTSEEVIKYILPVLLANSMPNILNIKSEPYGMTPLHHAVRIGDLKMIKALLANGADHKLRDCNGNLPSDCPIYDTLYSTDDEDVKAEIRSIFEDHENISASLESVCVYDYSVSKPKQV